MATHGATVIFGQCALLFKMSIIGLDKMVVEISQSFLSPHVMRRHVVYCMFLWVFFCGSCGNKIDEVWQQISRTGFIGMGRNFDCETLGLLGKVKLETLGLVVGGGVHGAWRSA